MTDLVIFDCDGVLVDSEGSILNYYNWLLDKANMPVIDWNTSPLRSRAFSMADKQILAMFADGDEDAYNRLDKITKTIEPPAEIFDIRLNEGVMDILQYLEREQMKMTVVTNRGKSLPRLLNHLKIERFFEKVVTSADVINPKPAPDGVFQVLDYYGVDAKHTIFIGDSETDYFAAKSSKVNFFSYRTHLYDAHVIKSFDEIKPFLKQPNFNDR